MKKNIFLILTSALIATSTVHAFDNERFEKDLNFYNLHKQDAQSIAVLLIPFNTDHGILDAFYNRANGNNTKWTQILGRLKNASDLSDKIGSFNYLSSCHSAVAYANSMWLSAAAGFNFGSWKDDFNKKEFENAKKDFSDNFLECKQVSRTPPSKEDYK